MQTKRRKWLFRLIAILLGLIPLVATEGMLRTLNLPAKPPAADPFVDLHNLKPLFEPAADAPDILQIGPSRLNLFRPASFPVKKSKNVFRVFALGGSTTQGEPYSTETAFPDWFGICLQSGMPDRQVEVINCGGLSYASYRVLAVLMEVLQYQPDLILVYTGHNEFLERRSYAGFERSSWTARAASWTNELRLVQLGRNLLGKDGHRSEPAVSNPTQLAEEVDALLDYEGGLAEYHRDEELSRGVASHFRWNLQQIVAACRASRVPLLLVKPVSNVLDCPPFKIETDPALSGKERERFEELWLAARQASSPADALAQGEAALEIDPKHAGANFLVGRLLVESGDFEGSGPYLRQARDYDVCPLRAPEYLTSIVEEVAGEHHVAYVDAEQLFAAESRAGLVGDNWLVDHIHPCVEGHQVLGKKLALTCIEAGTVAFTEDKWQERAQLAFTEGLAALGEDYFQRGQQRLEGLLLWTQGRAKKVRSEPTN